MSFSQPVGKRSKRPSSVLVEACRRGAHERRRFSEPLICKDDGEFAEVVVGISPGREGRWLAKVRSAPLQCRFDNIFHSVQCESLKRHKKTKWWQPRQDPVPAEQLREIKELHALLDRRRTQDPREIPSFVSPLRTPQRPSRRCPSPGASAFPSSPAYNKISGFTIASSSPGRSVGVLFSRR